MQGLCPDFSAGERLETLEPLQQAPIETCSGPVAASNWNKKKRIRRVTKMKVLQANILQLRLEMPLWARPAAPHSVLFRPPFSRPSASPLGRASEVKRDGG